jgi:hypothetical protein
MKLFLLERIGDYNYDENVGFVIRATSHGSAREIASNKSCGDEPQETWIDHEKSSCKEIKQFGKPGIILADFNAG